MTDGELSLHCFRALYEIQGAPKPTLEFNAGVNKKLQDIGYATIVMLPSPFKRSKGKNIGHLQITEKGAERLARETP